MIIAFDFERYLTQIFHLTMIQISSISPNQLINREYCAAINVRVLVFTPEQLKAITTLVVGLLRFRKKKKKDPWTNGHATGAIAADCKVCLHLLLLPQPLPFIQRHGYLNETFSSFSLSRFSRNYLQYHWYEQ